MGSSSIATIDCKALASNYARISEMTAPATQVGAVVKANGYGAGMVGIAETLFQAGCRHFYTAQLTEAIALRQALPTPQIICFEGPQSQTDMAIYRSHQITAVINSTAQFNIYKQDAESQAALPIWLHFDTGMARLGLSAEDVSPDMLNTFPIAGYMSHLASADVPNDPQNQMQLSRFVALTSKLPKQAMSLANSGGIFMGSDFHFGQVRPGLAIHGYASDPNQQATSGLTPILRWDAPILQIRTLRKGDTIGYGASFVADTDMRVATIGAGYADGYRRYLQNIGKIAVGDYITRPVGRISMDLMVIDVSHIPDQILDTTTAVCLLGPHYTAQDMAADLDTIPYEILTALGDRVVRAYDAASLSSDQ